VDGPRLPICDAFPTAGEEWDMDAERTRRWDGPADTPRPTATAHTAKTGNTAIHHSLIRAASDPVRLDPADVAGEAAADAAPPLALQEASASFPLAPRRRSGAFDGCSQTVRSISVVRSPASGSITLADSASSGSGAGGRASRCARRLRSAIEVTLSVCSSSAPYPVPSRGGVMVPLDLPAIAQVS
jgi:hypothetical protein